jgi:hypothetical protein
MAQWSRGERTLFAKIVYYGPAFGGKTTNLEALHRITDPANLSELVSVRTPDDRTMFFDVLPIELGEILGYRVAIKVYTVPGQVRYETTRRVVLAGADSVVFVADSSSKREQDNRWSLQSLATNLGARRLAAGGISVLIPVQQAGSPGRRAARGRGALARRRSGGGAPGGRGAGRRCFGDFRRGGSPEGRAAGDPGE